MKIIIHCGNKSKEIQCSAGILLSEAIQISGYNFIMPCGGNHTCGKCLVNIKNIGIKLACETIINNDCEVVISESNIAQSIKSIYNKGTNLGFAIDIGTTTIAVYLYELDSDKLLITKGEQNSQCIFGSDIISRIDYSNINSIKPLQERIIKQLTKLFKSCLNKTKAPIEMVQSLVITGNTTMLHFLTGKNPQGIAVMPFEAESYFGYEIGANELFPDFTNAKLYFPPCIKSYVGADITCGILASKLSEKENSILLDIGTNGEMALYTKGKILCTAAAAGPAFEGAGISHGMTATTGAITKLQAKNGSCETIGNIPAKGICGTGLISAINYMLKTNILDETGLLINEKAFELENDISINQKDIRALQLAKAAIAAGLQTLLHEANISEKEISILYLCGGFGSYIDYEEAIGIGLIPKVKLIKALGNAAGIGASMLLLNPKLRQEAERIAKNAKEISLSESEYFIEEYLNHIIFS